MSFLDQNFWVCVCFDDDGDDDDDDDDDDDCDGDGDDDDLQVRTNGPGHSNGKRGSHVSTVRWKPILS